MYIIGLLLIWVFSALSVAYLIKSSRQQGRIDVPNERSMHTTETPTGAGIVISACLIATVALFAIFKRDSIALYLLVILSVLTVVGWLDDKRNMGIWHRLAAFFVLAILLCFGVGTIEDIQITNQLIIQFPFWLACIFTSIGFVWVVNLYNFMDGMDGLAAIQTIVAAFGFSVIFLQSMSNLSWMLVSINSVLIASTIGFLIWNWHPAKIFMGDVGSLPIGGFFAVLIVCSVVYFQVSLWNAILMIGVFVFDTAFTLLRRAIKGENITQAHSSHLYQRLAKCGIAHHKIVFAYTMLMIACAGIAILSEQNVISSLLAGVFVLIGVISLLITVHKLESSLNE